MTSSPENKITRSDLVKSAVNVGALGMEFSWTYYKQMNIAFCLMVANMLKKIYAGRPDDYAEALHRHCAFFNITKPKDEKRPDARQVSRQIFLTAAEEADVREMLNNGVEVEIRPLADDPKVDCASVL